MGFFELFAAALTGFYALVKSYGLAIILLTLGVRIVLLPLSIKQTRSMREMQVIQPEIKRLQAKHKGDRQKLNEEMMKLYKEHGVNPFGGCLPLLMQFPVLIGLFYVVRSPLRYMGFKLPPGGEAGVTPLVDWDIQGGLSGIMETLSQSSLAADLTDRTLATNSFLGLRLDCSSSAALSGGNPLPIPGNPCGDGLIDALPYLIMVLLMGFTTYYQQKQMQASRGDQDNPQAQQMQMFMRIMPIMLMVFSFSFPTGVVLYWLTTNLWTIVQQRIVLKAAPPITLGAGGNGKGAGKQKAIETTAAVKSKAKSGTGDGAQQKPKATASTQLPSSASKPHPSSKKKKRKR